MYDKHNIPRIGLVTYYKENYGSLLQCYATKKFIEKLDIICDILEHKLDQRISLTRLFRLSVHIWRSLVYQGYLSHYLYMRNGMRKEKKYITQIAKIKIDNFIDEQLHPKKLTWSQLCELNHNQTYKAFIAGSDQIWNASINIEPIYFLHFADSCKRIALAPSFGIDTIPDFNVSNIKKGLSGFERISIREELGEQIVRKYSDRDCVRIADPTLLLDKEEWIAFGKSGYNVNNKYIFVHFLNEPSDLAIEFINYFAELNKYKIICFSYSFLKFSKLNGANLYSGSPIDYVNLILNSELVCTDSFHSTLFSIILEKEFYTFNRQYLHKFSQSCRIIDLLNRYNLSERLVIDNIKNRKFKKIDFQPVKIKYNKEREILISFLNEELKRCLCR